MTPPNTEPVPNVKPMTPPAQGGSVSDADLARQYQPNTELGRQLRKEDPLLNAQNRPNAVKPMSPVSVAAPDISGGVATVPSTVKPMTPPSVPVAVKPLPGTSAFTQQELNRIEEEKANPWGSANNHPGLLGKIGHIAAKVGNTALDVVAPGLAYTIPGTELNRQAREHDLKDELAREKAAEGQEANRQGEAELRRAQTRNLNSEAEKRENEQELISDPDGNVTGWKDASGVHSVNDADTPTAIRDIADSGQKRPRYEKDAVTGNIVELKRDADGNTTSEVVYKGQPNVKTETKTILGPDGKAHEKVFDVTPGSANFGKELADLGRAKEDKTPSVASELAKQKAGEQLVRGFDKDGIERMMPKAQAEEEGLSHISKATDKEWDDAKQNTTALNDMGAKVKNLITSSKALDQGPYQTSLIQVALGGHPDDWKTRIAISQMSPVSQAYVQDIFSLREAALALPKQTTGGSRVSEPQAQALWNTVPSAAGGSQYALSQLRKFDENLARLWKKVPKIEGQEQERPFGNETSSGGGKAKPLPKTGDVVDGYKFKGGDPKDKSNWEKQ